MAILSTYINARTGDYEVTDGNIVFADELATEIYSRIVTPKGSYFFDAEFGSTLASWINTRKIITAMDITTSIQEATLPVIEAGRALTIEVKVNAIVNNYVNFTVYVTDINNKTFQFTIPLRG